MDLRILCETRRRLIMFDKTELNHFYRYCFVLVNNEADAYDLLQTAFEKYLRSPPRQSAAKKSYLRKIIRNQFIDRYRGDQKIEMEIFDENIVTNINEDMSSLEEITINKEAAETIWSLLDPAEREIMYLWAIQGFTTSEVAKYLDIPKGTIVSKVSRLRKRVISKISSNIEYGAA